MRNCWHRPGCTENCINGRLVRGLRPQTVKMGNNTDSIHQGQTLKALYDITHDLITERDLPRLLYTIVERASQLLNGTGGGLYLCEPAQKQVRCVVSYNTPHDYTGTLLHYGEGVAGRVAQTEAPLIVNDYRTWEGRAPIYEEDKPFDQVLSVPMKWQTELIGVLHVLKPATEPHFTEYDLQLVTTFANQATIAVQNARLYILSQQELAERKQAEIVLQQSEARKNAILESALDGIITIDAAGHIVEFNPAAEQIFGYRREEVQGRPLTELIIPPHLRSQHQLGMAYYQATQQGPVLGQRIEMPALRADGTQFPIELSIVRIGTEDPAYFTGFVRDITAHKQRERELEAIATVANALRAAQSRAEMLPIVLDQMLDLLHAESAALDMLDPERGEIVTELGRGGWANVTGLRHPAGVGLTSYVMTTGKPYMNSQVKGDVPAERQVVRTDLLGEVTTVACVPLIVPGQVIGVAWVGTRTPLSNAELRLLMAIGDIAANAIQRVTVLETLEQQVVERTRELAEAYKQLQELDKLKDEFVSNVSHELRTPITNIKLYLNLLKQTGEERLSRYLPILLRENDRLARLIEDLLQLVQMEQESMPFMTEPQVLDALLAEVLETYTARIQAKSLMVLHEPNPHIPAILVDHAGITQVFNNLIGNAVAYTPVGGRIMCHITRQTAQVLITIHNSGPGIPPEDLPYLFDRFYRGKTGRASAEPGTGLGLAISRKIIEQHAGHIEADSREAEGTTFSIWLPIRLA
jgi:PAS domain S-box-containing protein